MRNPVASVDGPQIGACITIAFVFISVSFLFANSYVFNLLTTCTTSDADISNITDLNATDLNNISPFSVTEQSWLIFAVGIGTLIGTFVTLFTQSVNLVLSLTVFGVISGVLTVLMAVFDGFVPLLFLRLFHGVCLSPVFTASVMICKTQKPFLIHIFLSMFHVPLGLIIMNPLIGSFCTNWAITNYILGAMKVLFIFLVTISLFFTHQSNNVVVKKTSTLTYRVFINDTKQVSVFGSIFGTLFASQYIIQFAHVYFISTHGLTLTTIGWVTPIPYILAVWIMALIYYATKYKPRPLSAMISLFLCILFILLALIPQNLAWLFMILFLIIFVGAAVSITCLLQMAPIPSAQHLFYSAITICLINGLSIVILAVIVAAATYDGIETHWQSIFIAIAIVILVILSLANIMRQIRHRKWAEFNVSIQKPENAEEATADNIRPKQGVIVRLESACKVVSDRIHKLSIRPTESPDYSGNKTVAFIHDRERVTAV
uniref:MFS domain-containing protein n=1 Tax=Panagrellus redivivus TaxID=6233 RepID=A0A7E4V9S3_PANRE